MMVAFFNVFPLCKPIKPFRFYSILICLSLMLTQAAWSQGLQWGAVQPLQIYKKSGYYDIEQAQALWDTQQYEGALKQYVQASHKMSHSVIANYSLGLSLLKMAEQSTEAAQKLAFYTQAENAFLHAKELNPELQLLYYKLGKLATDQNRFEAALTYYQEGLQYFPDNAVLVFNLGTTLEKLNQVEAAEEAYQKCIALNPQFSFAYNNLGLIYEEQNRPQFAESMYRSAIESNPDYHYARLNLGSLLDTQKRYAEAVEQFNIVLRDHPDNEWATLYLGNVYYHQGQYEAALKYYQEALALQPSYGNTYFLVSVTLEKLDRTQEAVSVSKRYLERDPNGDYAHDARALIQLLEAKIEASR
jgi:tetratricopeptide (TPR) repeat protein